MNDLDEVFLTAYLDGELDSEHRQRVETAMLSDARLLDRLHALGAVREMVATLPRAVTCPDVSEVVLHTIVRRRTGVFAFPGNLGGSGSWTIRAGWLASAAVLLLAVLIGLTRQPPPRNPIVADAPQQPGLEVIPDESIEPGDVEMPTVEVAAETKAPRSHAAPELTTTERREESDRRQLRDLLDRNEPTRMLVVNSRPEADGANTVDKLLAKTSLRNAKFGRFRISQGVQIDPQRPGEATVFAVIMDETELRDVQANLKTAFQDSVVEAEARPEIVTQLADLNDVSLGSGIAVAGLRVPEGSTRAIRTTDSETVVKKSVTGPDGQVFRPNDEKRTGGTTASADTRRSNSSPEEKHAAGTLASRRDGDLPLTGQPLDKPIELDRKPTDTLVLIWVTSLTLRDPRFP